MKRQKGSREPEINRKTYDKVKKYDRQQLNDFCLDFYRMGREDERKELAAAAEVAEADGSERKQEAIDTEALLFEISQVKGIGPRTLAGVKEVIEKALGGTEG